MFITNRWKNHDIVFFCYRSNQIAPPVSTHFSISESISERSGDGEEDRGRITGAGIKVVGGGEGNATGDNETERTETGSLHSGSPEHFEMIETSAAVTSQQTSECESGGGGGSRVGNNAGERDDTSSLNDTDWTRVNACNDSETGSAGRRNSIERLEPADAESDPASLDILNSNSDRKRLVYFV